MDYGVATMIMILNVGWYGGGTIVDLTLQHSACVGHDITCHIIQKIFGISV